MSTISAALAQAVAKYGDAEAFVFPNAPLTYRQLAQRADAAAVPAGGGGA